MKNLNIWLINHYAADEGRHAFFSAELSRLGHGVTLFASSFIHYIYKESKQYSPNQYYLSEIDSRGFRRFWIKTPSYSGNNLRRFINQLVFAFNVTRCGLSVKEKPDIIIGSSVHPFTGIAAYLLAKKMQIPFIFEVRDLWPQTLVELGVLAERSPVTWLLRGLEKFLYKRAERVISVLPGGADYIGALGIDRTKVVHIPNGIDLKWFDEQAVKTPQDKWIEKVFRGNGSKLLFTYTGAMGPANGLDILIKAVGLLKEEADIYDRVKFILVGDGPEKQELEKMTERLSLENVIFIGYVDKTSIPFILTKSDVTISIVKKSNVHRFGVSMNKIFDYLASSNPMISAVGAPYDFAEEAECGFSILPDDPEQLAVSIRKMAGMNEGKKFELGKNGRRFVEVRHDYALLTKKLLEVIEESRKNYIMNS